MKKVFLDDLPRYKDSTYKGKINWGISVNMKINFIYDNTNGTIEIIDYNKRNHILYIKYLDYDIFEIKTNDFKKCQLGKLLRKHTNEFKIEIGEIFKNYNNDGTVKRDIIIIDRKIKKVDYKYQKYNKKMYKYKCNICGFNGEKHWDIRRKQHKEELWIEENNLFQGDGCACCCSNSLIVVEGINDIPTTAPWMIKYFQGGYDEAKLYTIGSSQKIYPICPDCGRIKDKKIIINTIYKWNSIGCSCTDGISYPNKFMYSLLEQLKIDFKTEYNPEWIKPKRYDFYFKLNNQEYIVEMDGGFHTKDNKMNGQTKEKSKEIDDYKDKLANEHNIEVIRINCNYENIIDRFNYIKNNIVNNKILNELFDLSKINWLKCEESALSNLVKIACEYKKNNTDMTTSDIGKIMNMEYGTIRKYLKLGNQLNWCSYNSKEELFKNNNKNKTKKSKPVEIFKNNISLGIFPSCMELERQSQELFGVKLNNSHIASVCNGKRKTHQGFTFKFINN